MVKRKFDLQSINRQYVRVGKITRVNAVRLLAEIVKEPGDVIYLVRDRVRHRLDYAVKNGDLNPPDAAGFVFDDLISWAHTVYSEEMRRASVPRKVSGSFGGEYFLPGGEVLPLDLEACHVELIRLYREVLGLSRQNVELRSELAKCLEKQNQIRNTAKINADKRWKNRKS